MRNAIGVRVEAGFEQIMGLLNLRLNKNVKAGVPWAGSLENGTAM